MLNRLSRRRWMAIAVATGLIVLSFAIIPAHEFVIARRELSMIDLVRTNGGTIETIRVTSPWIPQWTARPIT